MKTFRTAFILVINQLNAQILVFIISLLYVSTCFEHYVFSSGGQNCIIQSFLNLCTRRPPTVVTIPDAV